VSIVLRPLVVVVLLALAAAACGGGRAAPDRPRSTPTATAGTTGSGGDAGAAWTKDELLRRLAGRRVAIGDRTIRVDASTVTCGGTGRPAGRRGGRPTWRRFRCIQPTFPAGSVAGPDAIFVAAPVDRAQLRVTDRRLTAY
jgi:hypothetical protein